MDIPLDLTHHCIETAIRRRRNAAISHYFNSRGRQSGLDGEIALLGEALHAFDFNRLRSTWPPLAGYSNAGAVLRRGADGRPTLALDGILIVPPADLPTPSGRSPQPIHNGPR